MVSWVQVDLSGHLPELVQGGRRVSGDDLGGFGAAFEDGQSELGADEVGVLGAQDGNSQGDGWPVAFAKDLMEDPVAFGQVVQADPVSEQRVAQSGVGRDGNGPVVGVKGDEGGLGSLKACRGTVGGDGRVSP